MNKRLKKFYDRAIKANKDRRLNYHSRLEAMLTNIERIEMLSDRIAGKADKIEAVADIYSMYTETLSNAMQLNSFQPFQEGTKRDNIKAKKVGTAQSEDWNQRQYKNKVRVDEEIDLETYVDNQDATAGTIAQLLRIAVSAAIDEPTNWRESITCEQHTGLPYGLPVGEMESNVIQGVTKYTGIYPHMKGKAVSHNDDVSLNHLFHVAGCEQVLSYEGDTPMREVTFNKDLYPPRPEA